MENVSILSEKTLLHSLHRQTTMRPTTTAVRCAFLPLFHWFISILANAELCPKSHLIVGIQSHTGSEE